MDDGGLPLLRESIVGATTSISARLKKEYWQKTKWESDCGRDQARLIFTCNNSQHFDYHYVNVTSNFVTINYVSVDANSHHVSVNSHDVIGHLP